MGAGRQQREGGHPVVCTPAPRRLEKAGMKQMGFEGAPLEPYTASLNKFAYFYAMSSRHQKEQAAPFPSSLPLPTPLLCKPTYNQQAFRVPLC